MDHSVKMIALSVTTGLSVPLKLACDDTQDAIEIRTAQEVNDADQAATRAKDQAKDAADAAVSNAKDAADKVRIEARDAADATNRKIGKVDKVYFLVDRVEHARVPLLIEDK